MAFIKPFAALRPQPDLAARICELPYDVMSSDEARQIAQGNPLSFLHVSKPEIDLPRGTGLYEPEVYEKGKENLQRLVARGALRQDPQPFFYLYRQTMGAHSQTGLVAAASCADYLQGIVKKHELTRPDKEDDRVNHIETLGSQTGPVFLVYRASPNLDQIFRGLTGSDPHFAAAPPDIDFVAADGVRHTSWVINKQSSIALLTEGFANTPALYIADGHHRCAAAARVYQSRLAARGPAAQQDESDFFLSVIFPHNQARILPYNRVLRDLNDGSPQKLLAKLDDLFVIHPNGPATPGRKHELALYLAGRWYTLRFRPHLAATTDPIGQLDVTLLQKHVLDPIFGIDDPRTSKRLNFVGGIRGTAELENLVNSGEYACAFSLFPTSIEDLMTIADRGGIMPPKSTWFEPKLRDAMFCHMI